MHKVVLTAMTVIAGSVAMIGSPRAQSASATATIPEPVTAPGATPNPFTLMPGPKPPDNPGNNVDSSPSPGGVQVRLNARVDFYAGASSDSGRNPGSVSTLGTGGTPIVVTPANTKLAPYTFNEYTRLFPGFDAMAANGLKYGGAMEIRQDNGEPPGGGVNGSISQGSRNRNALYLQLAYGYVGTDRLGFLRFGSTYGASTLLSTGTFENFNDGGWNGDALAGFTSNTQVTWPFATASSYYATTKLVYVSPQFAGTDFGLSFEPNTATGQSGPGNCPYANTAAGTVTGPIGGAVQGQGCDAASSTSTGDDARRRDTIEAFARYRSAFGPVGVAVNLGGIFSGRVLDNSTPAKGIQYDSQRVLDGGLAITYGGLAVGGHVTTGRVNGLLSSLDPTGEKDEFAWLVGVSYAFGPFIVGTSYYDLMSAGAKTPTTSAFVGNRNEYGVAAGGTFTFAPGMNLFLSYLYGHRKELGVDLLSGVMSPSAADVTSHNNVQAQGITLGTQFRW